MCNNHFTLIDKDKQYSFFLCSNKSWCIIEGKIETISKLYRVS